jgi:hypothetical protein
MTIDCKNGSNLAEQFNNMHIVTEYSIARQRLAKKTCFLARNTLVEIKALPRD